VIDAGNRGNGGRRRALPAFFALASAVAVAFAVVMTGAVNVAGRSGSGAVTTPPESAPVAKVEPLAERAPPGPQTPERRMLEIERALVSNNPEQREAAFNVSLPELLEAAPARVIEMVARQEGEARDTLRDEVVRLWIRKDRDAALVWMGSFENEWERKASATIAMRTLAAIEPAQAIAVADQFGIGRDDGSLEHIVQIWAAENFDECMKWLASQPDNAWTAQLRARAGG
jgi:hypothetical protein